MRRNALLVLMVAVAIAAGVVWYLRRGSSGADEGARAEDRSRGAGPAGAATGAGLASPPPEGGAAAGGPARGEARAKRDALRAQIERQLASRAARADAGTGPAARPPAEPRPPGNLRNNLGGRDALVAHLNQEFMPLASECIEQAEARSPSLAGMLAIGLETIADEQLGAVVDVADPAPTNNVLDPLLFECIRESAFSLTLPPPLTSGRERFELTLPVGASPDAGVPR